MHRGDREENRMRKALALLLFLCLAGFSGGASGAERLPDAPQQPGPSAVESPAAGSYAEALAGWQTPEDISRWIGANFSYDTPRAMRLSETQRAAQAAPPIYEPAELFEKKTGVCVDLTRFAVETLRGIDPQSDPKYLMIEFEPVQIAGNTLRLHWLASFQRGGKTWFFADSKRPGHIAGPYADAQAFLSDYEQFRGRKIVSFRELASYRKQKKTKALKQQAPGKP